MEDWGLQSLPSMAVGRTGHPEEVAKLVAYLASDEADYVTGRAVNTTGGQEVH